jgi:hypothetical protein
VRGYCEGRVVGVPFHVIVWREEKKMYIVDLVTDLAKWVRMEWEWVRVKKRVVERGNDDENEARRVVNFM